MTGKRGGRVAVFAVDVGSVKRKGGFSWSTPDGSRQGQDDPSQLADALAAELATGDQVALAFESPLSVPVPDSEHWAELGRARDGDGNRAWSAGAGPGVMATGLVQLAWVLRYLAERLSEPLSATTQVERFLNGEAQLLIAEAMVTGAGKPIAVAGGQDQADALAAAQRLDQMLGEAVSKGVPSDARCAPQNPLNLAAVAAMHAGIAIDPDELNLEVLVAKTS